VGRIKDKEKFFNKEKFLHHKELILLCSVTITNVATNSLQLYSQLSSQIKDYFSI